MSFLFQRLHVYRRALLLAVSMTKLAETFPRGCAYLRDQLSRAALSIPLNIAEGNGRRSCPERTHFFVVARASLHECVSVLEFCQLRGLITDEQVSELGTELNEISMMITGLMKDAERRT